MTNSLTKLYMFAVVVLGFAIIVVMTILYPVSNVFSLVFFLILGIITETQSVRFDNGNIISITSAIIICALTTSGTTVAIWVAALSVLGTVTKTNGKYKHVFNTKITHTMFNSSVYVLSIAAFALSYFALGGKVIHASSNVTFESALSQITLSAIPLIVSIIFSTIVNTLIIVVYMAFSTSGNIIRMWVSNLLWSVLSLFIVGLLGVIITAAYTAFGWFFVVLFFAPFLLARYAFILYKDLQQNYLQTVKSLAAAIEAKDEYTIGHSKRVEAYCSMIAEEMKLSVKRCEYLRYAALLHDIGKIGIDDQILNKSQSLSATEWDEVKQHPEKGAHILEDIQFLSNSVDIIRAHHERYDGKGYPLGLTGKDLPLEAMILTVADSYDAMTSNRPYKRTFTSDEAMEELRKGSGKQFSPEVVEAFSRAMCKRGNLKIC